MGPRSSFPARLVADGGAAATTDDFFRSVAFLHAEGTTHSLLVEAGATRIALPLIVRPIAGTDHRDAVSPYGYPGGRREGPPVDRRDVDFSSTGLVSLFLRETLPEPTLLGAGPRSRVHLFDPRRPRSVSSTFMRHVRRNDRDGYTVEAVDGVDVDDTALRSFHTCYTETMVHTGASERYFFTVPYLRSCLDVPGTWLIAVRAPDGSPAAGAIAVRSDGLLHYYLGGTADAHRPASPAKNGFVRLMDLAEGLGVPLNLGGGLVAGDGLDRFKESFGNAVDTFTTHEVIADADAYAALCPRRPARTDFFPAYRG